jgi:hypothetical protein
VLQEHSDSKPSPKDNKIVSGFKHNYIFLFYFYLNEIFRPVDHHQGIRAKVRNEVQAVQIAFMQYGNP